MFAELMGWLQYQFDTQDIVILSLILLATAYYLYNRWKEAAIKQTTPNIVRFISPVVNQQHEGSFIKRMKNEARQVLIVYGSQTGTAEELAGRLSTDLLKYGKKAIIIDPEEVDVEEFELLKDLTNVLLILCMATYGEGDPTDNAQQFYEYISSNSIDLSGLSFAVFGLGNKTYEHYNEMGKYFDRRMEDLGAKRIYELGLGDDDGNLEEDFMRWRESFWPVVAQTFAWTISDDVLSERQYKYELIDDPSVKLFIGEYGRLGAFEKQRPPFDQKNPYYATIVVNSELHASKSERSCRHIEFSTNGARVRYEAGDHLGVFPTNDPALVEELSNLIGFNLEQAFQLINIDSESSKRNPFPCPCTIRTALTHYVDICAPVKSHVLKAIAEFAVNEEERKRIELLSTANEVGLKEYSSFVQKERRSILDILKHFPSCRPPIELLLELLPRLQARYYSISSSSKFCADRIAITVIITRYNIGNRHIKGVCTNYLLKKAVNDKIPIFIRRSTMRLPHKLLTPVIMIGPGTGFAPFRGFLQERQWHKQQGKEIGPLILYFGCRHPEHDYVYEDEINEFVRERVLSELHLAFSRVSANKVYVQDKIWENRTRVWQAIENSAHVYICGDARNMARDVQNTFIKIFMEEGQMDDDKARKFQKELERQRRYQADVWS